jgi:hypothetical protein
MFHYEIGGLKILLPRKKGVG